MSKRGCYCKDTNTYHIDCCDSTWGGGYDKEAYDRGGWGPDVGGYNDPGAFGGSMGSSPGDKSTW